MAAPITWRNVDGGPNPAAAAIPLAYSQQSINGAFDAFNNILKQRASIDQANAAATGEAAKQAFLDQLAAAKTPEQLAAMQPQLDAARQSLTAAGQAAVRGADEARLTSLRQQATAAQAYNDQQRAIAERPLRDNIASDVAMNNFDGAIEKVEASSLADKAPLLNSINTARRNLAQQIYADADAQSARELRTVQANATKLDLAQKEKSIQAANTVDNVVGERLNAFQNDTQNQNAKIAEQARDMGLELDPRTGLPDPAKLTPTQAMVLNSRLTALGLNVAKTSSTYLEDVRSTLASKGLPLSAIESGVASADKLLKGKTQLTAEDTAEINRLTGVVDARYEDAKKNNLYFTPPPDLQAAKTSVLEKVDKMVKDGPMTKTRIREKLSSWMDDGIFMKDPKTGQSGYFKVPPKVIEAALASGLEDDTWFVNGTVENMEPVIQRFLTDPQYKDQREEAVWLLNNGHVDLKNQITRDFKINAGTVTPSDWLAGFSRTLEKAKSK